MGRGRRSGRPLSIGPAQVAEQVRVGLVLVPEKLAWKPKEVLPPAARAPLKAALFAVTAVPLEVTVAFHEFTIFWVPPQVQVTFQVLVATVPGLLTVTLALKPLPQLLEIE
jgi:hypothetical protein